MSQWQQVNRNYAALSLREKVLILATSVVVMLFLLGNFVIEPQLRTLEESKKTTRSLNKNIQDAIAGRVAIEQKIASDPKGQLIKQLEALKGNDKQLKQALALQQMSLISSSDMAMQLQYLVAEQKGLTVESLNSMAPVAILFEQPSPDKEHAKPKPLLFRHAVEIQVKGRYFDVVSFLQSIEQQNEFLLWGDIHYEVTKYPDALVTFVVSTVSTDKEFIGVR